MSAVRLTVLPLALTFLAAASSAVTGAQAPAQAPVRLLVIASTTQQLPEAYKRFEETYGAGLLQLEMATEEVDPSRLRDADVILAYYLNSFHEQRLAEAVKAARARGATILVAPASAGQRHWDLAVDPAVNGPVVEYWDYGGVENMTAFLAYAYVSAGGTAPLRVPPPVPQIDRGIYHPRAAAAFGSLREYLAWYRTQPGITAATPLVGLTFFSTNWKFRDLDHVDALIAAFEKRGVGVVAAFGWPLGQMGDLLADEGVSPLRVLFVLNQSMASRPEDAKLLEALGVHTINLIATRQSYAEWERDPRGMPIDRVRNVLDLPELAGATEPLLFSTSEPAAGADTRVSRVVPERLDMLVARTARWMALQDKPAAAKKIAFIYYNNPPGKGNVGASYLAVYPTLRNILERLQREGYSVGARLPDERQLMELLERSGRNVELWGPGDLRDMVSQGTVTLVPMATYKAWFAKLPRRYREATTARWGRPEDAKLMTVAGPDGQRAFVVPGIRLGNVFLGPQPLRSTFEEAASTAHDPETPVPHQYIAAYLWYRYEFGADAIVHVGRHGTLEWLPGKQVAQAGWDTSEVLLGDVPSPYFYIMDGGGEAIQAKRRSAAVLISHLTPMIVKNGPREEFEPLHDALENLENTEGTSADLAEAWRQTARDEIRRLKLDDQLGFDLDAAPWPEVEERVHTFLHATENDTVPLGIHALGTAPPEANQIEGLAAFLANGFDEADAALIRDDVSEWAAALFEGRQPEIAPHYPARLRERIEQAFAEGEEWMAGVRASPARELDALVTVLNGRYLPTGVIGDPLHSLASLPTGRNEHGLDTSLIPTRQAWQVGRAMADEFLARYRKQHGTHPEKISQVLWSGETLRHQGALECMALALMGVEPIWNARGVADGLRLIPDEELGRPRVDVVFTISGSYRDSLPEKVLLLDRAVRLAASAGPNVIRRHDEEVEAALVRAGVPREQAAQIARARVFGNKPSSYGVGVSEIVEQSKDADGHTADLGRAYLHNMNYAFSSEVWGGTATDALASHLTGNQAVLFSRSTNLYGAVDNDDVYQYFGGLSVASRTVNGEAPDMYINNLRKSGAESLSDLRAWLASELNARNWNRKWLTEMQRSGYAGAREMAREIEFLYGFQATSAEQMSGTFWQNTYDVFVADKHGLDLDEFFNRENPYAQQSIAARLLEVDRQGSYRFSDDERAELVRMYVESVARHGISCSANTCGNLKVNQYVAEQAPLVEGLGNETIKRFGRRLARATGWTTREFATAPAALQQGIREALRPRPAAPVPRSAEAPDARPPDVSGYKIEEQITSLARTAAPLAIWPYVAIALLVAAGLLRESRRRLADR